MNGKKPTVISLFAGCGGSSLGYQMAGYQELLAIDFDIKAIEVFRLNFDIPIWQRDITQVSATEILDFCNLQVGELDILDGSPPCQGFSLIKGKRQISDSRNSLIEQFIRLVKELQPKIFIMENVAGLVKGVMKGKFKEIMINLKTLNYYVKCELLNAAYYGVAQNRQRLIWCGVRKDLNILPVLPPPQTRILAIQEIIGDLVWQKQDNAVQHIWIDERKTKTKSYLKALSAKQGQKFIGFQKKYRWDRPINTIIAENSGSLYRLGCHPLEIRPFSVRECARLQSFPDSFILLNNDKINNYRVLGNAVPPLMMKAIAQYIREKILAKLENNNGAKND